MRRSSSTPNMLAVGTPIKHVPSAKLSSVKSKTLMKSVSTNALSDMAMEAIYIAPMHHVATCVVQTMDATSTNREHFLNFAACVASPPDLIDEKPDHNSIINMRTSIYERQYLERFQTYYDMMRRKKKQSNSASDLKNC